MKTKRLTESAMLLALVIFIMGKPFAVTEQA